MMNLLGKKVKHSKFGDGVITGQDDSFIAVRFQSEAEPKKFMYPACFKTFLTLLDASASNHVSNDLKMREDLERKKKQQALDAEKARHYTKELQNGRPKSQKSVTLRPFASVEEFCAAFRQATVSEVMYLKKNGGKRQHIFDGRLIEHKSNRFLYTFESDDELKYPEGTQISIWKGEVSVPGNVVGCEDFTITISTGTDFGAEVPFLEFSAEAWRLLSSLATRLDAISIKPTELVRALICDGHTSIDYRNSTITTGQATAVQMSKTQPITFVWGPPGTGKTQTLAKIALAHIELGHRVLMLSYSNVSVDGAILRVHKMRPDLPSGTLLRYGYARETELLDHRHLTAYNFVIHSHPELLQERQSLIFERKKLSHNSSRYIQIGRRLTQIKSALVEEEKSAIRNASFVATTVSKTVVDAAVRECNFDVVIFDEASMAYIPQIVFAASLAKKHFVCMGDFRQLPPIVQSDAKSPLNADIFQYCGITAAVDSGRNHKWLCMLDRQYRMHPHIADFASRTMYGNLLHSAEGMARSRMPIVNHSPIPGHAMAFADLTGMMSVCTKTGDNSRVNVLSALISFSLALESAKHHEVGIITPYHAQSRLLHAMARDAAAANPGLNAIACATVHQFQGSEKDVIIYDAVDCYRMPYPGMLLTSTGNNYANRLFNVALTRAKGKFIGVANIAYMDNKNLSKGLMFEQMIETQRRKASCVSGHELSYRHTVPDSNIMHFFELEDGYTSFLKDIALARSEIRIDIPDKPVDDVFSGKLAVALKTAKGNGIKVYLRAENKQSLPSALKPLAIENPFVANPMVIIDKKIAWFGMPASDARFKSEGSILQTKYRPVIRFEGKYTAASLYGFLEMSRTVDQAKVADPDGNDNLANYVLAKKSCSSCGKPMQLKKSTKGKFYLSCTACQQTEFIDVALVEKYFFRHGKICQQCARCKCSLEAKKGPYGLYVQCCGLQKHKYRLDEI